MKPRPSSLFGVSCLLLLLSGCLSDDQWSFPMTRKILDDPAAFSGPPSEAAIFVYTYPVVVDFAILPVTLPRDLYHWLWVGDI